MHDIETKAFWDCAQLRTPENGWAVIPIPLLKRGDIGNKRSRLHWRYIYKTKRQQNPTAMKTYSTFYLELGLSFITALLLVIHWTYKINPIATNGSDLVSCVFIFVLGCSVLTCFLLPIWYGILFCIRWILSKTKLFSDM